MMPALTKALLTMELGTASQALLTQEMMVTTSGCGSLVVTVVDSPRALACSMAFLSSPIIQLVNCCLSLVLKLRLTPTSRGWSLEVVPSGISCTAVLHFSCSSCCAHACAENESRSRRERLCAMMWPGLRYHTLLTHFFMTCSSNQPLSWIMMTTPSNLSPDSNVLPALSDRTFGNLLSLRMMVGGSLPPSAVTASITVKWRLSPLDERTLMVLAPRKSMV
mmetsp:Transcript_27973/g.61383  ORF Transcript_27973/g.61383 Transcript_27973/m.61383 type:complete len:221 (-) Transcript_27973:534-1196(-)